MIAWAGEMDPAEKLDFGMDFRGGDDPVLEVGETIASYSLATTAEAAAFGLQIESAGAYSPAIDSAHEKITIWLSVAAEEQASAEFLAGVPLGVEVTIITSNTPPRTRQRTFLATVKQL